jgi:hypothetical protein
MEFKLCSLPCRAFKQTKFLYYINSLCSGVYMVVSLCVTADMCWSGVYAGHGTDVTRTGMWTDGFRNTTGMCTAGVEVYVLQGPPQESPVVFGYIEVSCERYSVMRTLNT